MPINLSSICIAFKDAKSCPGGIDLINKLKNRYRANIKIIATSKEGIDLATGGDVTIVNSEKEAISHMLKTPSDLVILSISLGQTGTGFISAKEANSLIDKLEGVVLTIPDSKPNMDFSNIVVPLDTSSETRQKVPYAVEFARIFGSTIHVLGVSSETGRDAEVLIKNYIRQVCTNIEEKGIRVSSDLRLGGNPTEKVLEFAKQNNMGLITIMTEQETSLVSFFKGKYSEQMIKNAAFPVLSIHPKDLIVSEARL
jgi:nucleotide-binding universal stress UspA family protein